MTLLGTLLQGACDLDPVASGGHNIESPRETRAASMGLTIRLAFLRWTYGWER